MHMGLASPPSRPHSAASGMKAWWRQVGGVLQGGWHTCGMRRRIGQWLGRAMRLVIVHQGRHTEALRNL